jgi:hypothetical protein
MELQQSSTNRKALNLEGLEVERNKVTIGFKCQAQMKLRLANEASSKGLTLSEYVETLIMTNNQNHQTVENHALQTRLNFYEKNSMMVALFDQYKGSNHSIALADGRVLNLKIEEIKDVFTIIINKAKSKTQ